MQTLLGSNFPSILYTRASDKGRPMANSLFERKPLALLLEEMKGENRLRRVLGPVTLTSLGVGAIIGTGIFVLTGVGAHDKAGPALTLSFALAGIACVFAALCYAEFASMVPVAGSAYTYAYATLGELFAWIIGWDLVLEYAVGSSTVAHGWSAHFHDLLKSFGIQIPFKFSSAPFDFNPETGRFFATGAYFDVMAIVITVIITAVLVKGIRESAGFNAGMVVVKLAIVLFVIVVGSFYVDPANWIPFAPYGYTGLSFFGHTLFGQTGQGGAPLGALAGAAIIFFAYIGFDSVSTHAEEAKNPRRDVPIGIIASLIICTILYIVVSAILTGMVRYDQIDINAPVADAFRQKGLPWARRLIDIGAITGITSVLLVMMLSQPRVLLAMARDGMVPPKFFGADSRKVPHTVEIDHSCGHFRFGDVGISAAENSGRAHEYRHAACVRDCLFRGARHALQASRSRASVSSPVRAPCPDSWNSFLSGIDVFPAAGKLVAPDYLAWSGLHHLFQLQPTP